MFKLVTIFTLIILSISINSQNRWEKLNGPVGAAAMGLFAQGDTLLVGTGYRNGKIFYSVNGGANWTKAGE